MTVTNDELMAEVQAVKTQLSNQHHVWKRAEHVAKHFDVSLGTVKSWKQQGLITPYKHQNTVIYDLTAIERDVFQVQN
ncbi:hypothetical protein AB3K25_04315 [Leuconostoc sp. MS02]|uniref:HTH merR-type domain-containing protein n=1 Tax=Leuconostoc aquikimchii TaxID=3236804 RepID=A0ABV3S3G4_9LACO